MSYRADKQVIDTHTHTLTDTQTGAMTIPEGQNWPRVKNLVVRRGPDCPPIERSCIGLDEPKNFTKLPSCHLGELDKEVLLPANNFLLPEAIRHVELSLDTFLSNIVHYWYISCCVRYASKHSHTHTHTGTYTENTSHCNIKITTGNQSWPVLILIQELVMSVCTQPKAKPLGTEVKLWK